MIPSTFNSPIVFSALFAVLGLLFLIMTITALRKKKIFGTTLNFVTALLMLSLAALFGTISIAIQGYHALTKEELAAAVKVKPAGEQRFIAYVSLPNGVAKTFALAGDQLYVDAHILKWKPLANIFGLHTSYELDRLSGRYALLADETTKARTAYSLSYEKPVDMFDLRRRFTVLNPLLDAEYGSATFISANSAEEFRVLVSTTGLLIRKSEHGTGQ
jgi:hypothetical protein